MIQIGDLVIDLSDPVAQVALAGSAVVLLVLILLVMAVRRAGLRSGDRLLEVPSNPIELMTSPLLSRSARLRLGRGRQRARSRR